MNLDTCSWLIAIVYGKALVMIHDEDSINLCNNANLSIIKQDISFSYAWDCSKKINELMEKI